MFVESRCVTTTTTTTTTTTNTNNGPSVGQGPPGPHKALSVWGWGDCKADAAHTLKRRLDETAAVLRSEQAKTARLSATVKKLESKLYPEAVRARERQR